MFKIFITLLIAGLFAFQARADGPVLVELFAAKSCFASPRANKLLSTVSETREDVQVLTWPVDYWDYLGKEPLALDESNDRQLAYVDRFGLRGPYTPQTVFDGKTQSVGSRAELVLDNIDAAGQTSPSGVELANTAGGISISGPEGAEGDVYIIHYLQGESNPSRMINPVSEVKRLLYWAGEDLRIDASICHGSCVVVVQERGFGKVLATMRLPR